MQSAAKNQGGAAMGFMGMNMAGAAGGMNPQALYQMGQQQPAPAAPVAPVAPVAPATPAEEHWTCPSCGNAATGQFCVECGTKKPTGMPQYKCSKCGWVSSDPTKPPKFCAQCGAPFDQGGMA